MDTTNAATVTAKPQDIPSADKPLDPLRRVFVPVEKRLTEGGRTFVTSDNVRYLRRDDGQIRRRYLKVNGKEAKKLRRKQRQTETKKES